jgi:nucleoside-diphosphate-sugar epimerase
MELVLTGATGYLGGAVLRELLDHGHEVVAPVRSAAAASAAAAAGARPEVGELADPAWLRGLVAAADGVVHTASPNDATSAALDAAVLDAVLPVLDGRPYVHTGGTWIHGSGPRITEDTPVAPPPMVAWRPAVVGRVRAAGGRVVGPANLYGDGGGLPALLRGGPVTGAGELLFPGGDQRFANLHRADAARLFRLVLEGAEPGGYYLAANADAPTMREVAAAASPSGRARPEPVDDTRRRLGPLADPLLLDQRVDAARARALGWAPTGPTLLDELATGSHATEGARS